MKKSIAFIYLPHPWLKNPDAQLPLGILYLAALTKEAGYKTTIYNFSSYGDEDIAQTMEEHSFFAITATSLEIPMANHFGIEIKKLFPKCKLLIGGPGTITPEYIDKCFDLIYIGEAERDFTSFLDYFPMYRMTHVCENPVQNLDSLPFPARELIHGKLGGEIFAFGKHYIGQESTTIISSRGCPYNCSFCAAPKVKVRLRDPKMVVAEMKLLYEWYNISEFRFNDDSFTMNPYRVLEICKMIRNNFKDGEIAWRVSCRVKPIDKNVISAMVEAGCKEFSFGIESFDQDVLDRLTKGVTVEDNIHALKLVNSVGGKARVLFMIRTPGQTLKTVDKNIEVLEKVPYALIACTSFAPLPGSAIWDNPEKFGIRILSRKLEDYNFYFYGAKGKIELKRLFSYINQSTDAIEIDSERFRTYLESTGKLNQG